VGVEMGCGGRAQGLQAIIAIAADGNCPE
jgi:hypothetical protein